MALVSERQPAGEWAGRSGWSRLGMPQVARRFARPRGPRAAVIAAQAMRQNRPRRRLPALPVERAALPPRRRRRIRAHRRCARGGANDRLSQWPTQHRRSRPVIAAGPRSTRVHGAPLLECSSAACTPAPGTWRGAPVPGGEPNSLAAKQRGAPKPGAPKGLISRGSPMLISFAVYVPWPALAHAPDAATNRPRACPVADRCVARQPLVALRRAARYNGCFVQRS
jgi:hypothetical protein